MCCHSPLPLSIFGTSQTCVQVTELQRDSPVLSKDYLQTIQARVFSVRVPSHAPREDTFQNSIYFSGFTADQWKTWSIVYSPFALPEMSSSHLECWQNRVSACRILCNNWIMRISYSSHSVMRCCVSTIVMLHTYLCLHLQSCESIRDFGLVFLLVVRISYKDSIDSLQTIKPTRETLKHNHDEER